jgi:hypothetical protein
VTIGLFAGIPVRDYTAAAAWYERLLGAPPSFLPNDIEAVWELAHGPGRCPACEFRFSLHRHLAR